VFIALNAALRRQRRRLATLAVMLGIAGVVVTAHSVLGGDHMGDGVLMCLAVADTAVVAIGTALAAGIAAAQKPRWFIAVPALPAVAYARAPRSVPARAGPAVLQVFRF
jgi:hypothetical protein